MLFLTSCVPSDPGTLPLAYRFEQANTVTLFLPTCGETDYPPELVLVRTGKTPDEEERAELSTAANTIQVGLDNETAMWLVTLDPTDMPSRTASLRVWTEGRETWSGIVTLDKTRPDLVDSKVRRELQRTSTLDDFTPSPVSVTDLSASCGG